MYIWKNKTRGLSRRFDCVQRPFWEFKCRAPIFNEFPRLWTQPELILPQTSTRISCFLLMPAVEATLTLAHCKQRLLCLPFRWLLRANRFRQASSRCRSVIDATPSLDGFLDVLIKECSTQVTDLGPSFQHLKVPRGFLMQLIQLLGKLHSSIAN